MKQYLIPFLLYIFTDMLLDWLGVSPFVYYPIKVLVVLASLAYFWKDFTEIKFKFDWQAWLVGLGIIAIWIGIDSLYPHMGESSFDPTVLEGVWMYLIIAFRIFGAVVIAALVEELFIRSFLARFIISNDNWDKVKIGTYSLASFAFTVFIFGIAHNRWLAGIITGFILNLWLYYKKDISSCIQAHSSANLFLALYVLLTQSWMFW